VINLQLIQKYRLSQNKTVSIVITEEQNLILPVSSFLLALEELDWNNYISKVLNHSNALLLNVLLGRSLKWLDAVL